MNRSKHKFTSRTIVLRSRGGSARRFKKWIFYLLVPLLFFSLIRFFPVSMPSIPSALLRDAIRLSFPFFGETEFFLLPTDHYTLISSVFPCIRANEVMAKRYALLYNERVQRKKEDAAPKTDIIQDRKIQTISMAAGGIKFNNASNYTPDADALLTAPLSFGSKRNEPRVLIVHTHTSEAYLDSPNGRSTDPAKNVVRVGEEIAAVLNRSGIKTIHDKTKNDEPDYNGSYKKALSVIQQNLLQYPSLEIVLDIHRDYTVRDAGTPSEIALKPTQTENGKDAAQIMFVMGTDSMGLYHPNWQHNLSFAVKLQKKAEELHPSLCRPINIRTERFNQHMTKGSMIIEVGSSTNTLEEAITAGHYIGEIVAAVLNGS